MKRRRGKEKRRAVRSLFLVERIEREEGFLETFLSGGEHGVDPGRRFAGARDDDDDDRDECVCDHHIR